MEHSGIGKIFRTGRSQAVRLPQAFRFTGDRVRIRRLGRGILLEPIVTDLSDWFAALDRDGDEPFPARGAQPAAPIDDPFG